MNEIDRALKNMGLLNELGGVMGFVKNARDRYFGAYKAKKTPNQADDDHYIDYSGKLDTGTTGKYTPQVEKYINAIMKDKGYTEVSQVYDDPEALKLLSDYSKSIASKPLDLDRDNRNNSVETPVERLERHIIDLKKLVEAFANANTKYKQESDDLISSIKTIQGKKYNDPRYFATGTFGNYFTNNKFGLTCEIPNGSDYIKALHGYYEANYKSLDLRSKFVLVDNKKLRLT